MEREAVDRALILAAVLCGSVLLLQACGSFVRYKIKSGTDEFNVNVRSMLADRVYRESYEKYERKEYREKYQFAQKCVEKGSIETVMNAAASCVSCAVSFAALVSVMAVMELWLWIVMLLSVAISVASELYRVKQNFDSAKSQESIEYKMLYARDRMTWKSFAKEVRLFNMYDYVTKQASKYIDALSTLQKERSGKIFRTLLFSYICNGLQMLAIYGYFVYQCFKGVFSVTQFSVLTISALSITSQASSLAAAVVSIKEVSLYIDSFADLIRSDAELCESKDENAAAGRPVSEIAFYNVSFKYDGREENALSQIDVLLKGGKKYGIVGVNGSGKTTFVNLLMGLYSPSEGSITVNGAPISSVTEHMKLFSTVFQDYNIYPYTLKDNICMGAAEDAGRIKRILNDINFPESDPDAYVTTEYSDNGAEFSGGEEQKIAIARALYRDAPVFVLDEPSSSLSPNSEADLYRIVGSYFAEKTVFFISHRLASCTLCDEILVFDNGRIVEFGSHAELMEKQGLYEKMFSLQKSLYTDEEE